MFIDTGKIVGGLGNKPPVMTNTVSVEIDLLEKFIKDYFLRYGRKLKKFGIRNRVKSLRQSLLMKITLKSVNEKIN